MTGKCSMTMTDSAVAKIKELLANEEKENLMLRAFIYGGGCSGMSFGFTFDDAVKEKDNKFDFDGVALLVDPMSMEYLNGGEIDFAEEQFAINNVELPKGGCGSCSGCH